MAWQAIVSSPEVAKESKHQIVETEHLMKSLLEQRNGLARRIFSKAGVDNTRLLDAAEKFIQRQPKVLHPQHTLILLIFTCNLPNASYCEPGLMCQKTENAFFQCNNSTFFNIFLYVAFHRKKKYIFQS
jgi:ATP-dependent Clp protease ATP-binding subunit ClpA